MSLAPAPWEVMSRLATGPHPSRYPVRLADTCSGRIAVGGAP